MENKDLTAKDVWAMFAETNKRMQETDRKAKELREDFEQQREKSREDFEQQREKSREDFDQQMKKSREEFDLRMKDSQEKFDKRLQETDKLIKDISKQMGGIDEDIGDHAEQYFQNALEESLTFDGEKYDVIIKNMDCSSGSSGTEFDIVLINSKSLAIIEVKSRFRQKFVKSLAEEKVGKFRKHLSKYDDLKVYLGIAGFSFSKKVLEEAEKRGIGVIRQVGKSIEMSKYSLKAY